MTVGTENEEGKGEVTGELKIKDIQALGQAPYSVQCQEINDPESPKTFVNFTSIGNNSHKEHISETDLFEEDCQPKWLKCKKFSHLQEDNSKKFILKGTDKLTVALDSGGSEGSSPHFLEVAQHTPCSP